MIVLKVLGYLLGIVASIAIAFSIPTLVLNFEQYFAPKFASVKRESFEQTKSYVHGMIESLSDYKREYDRAESIEEKQQIINYIDSKFAAFDESNIDNSELRTFLSDVRSGKLK